MSDIEKEYRRIFLQQKKCAKHWLTPSAHRSQSSTIGMMGPARKTLQYIESLEVKKISNKEKLNSLQTFYEEQNQLENKQSRMGSDYYFNCIRYCKSEVEKAEASPAR